MSGAFKQVNTGGPIVYDINGDGSGGYCDAVAPIIAGSPTLPSGGTLTAGTLSATTAAAQLASNQACKSVLVQNLITNTVDIFIGDSNSQPFRLTPGQAIALPVSNTNLVYIKTVSSTASVPWISIV